MFRRLFTLMFASSLTIACTDRAQPDYAKCLQADTASDVKSAWDSCNAAIGDDPNSTSGKAAAAKLVEMKPKYDKLKADEDAKAAAAAAAQAQAQAAAAEQQRQAQAAAMAAARRKVHRERSETFDDSCSGQSKPGRSFRYGGGTYDVNAAVAQADGCQPEDNNVGWKGFVCCP